MHCKTAQSSKSGFKRILAFFYLCQQVDLGSLNYWSYFFIHGVFFVKNNGDCSSSGLFRSSDIISVTVKTVAVAAVAVAVGLNPLLLCLLLCCLFFIHFKKQRASSERKEESEGEPLRATKGPFTIVLCHPPTLTPDLGTALPDPTTKKYSFQVGDFLFSITFLFGLALWSFGTDGRNFFIRVFWNNYETLLESVCMSVRKSNSTFKYT